MRTDVADYLDSTNASRCAHSESFVSAGLEGSGFSKPRAFDLSWAKKAIALGLPLIPLCGKKPVAKGWKNAPVPTIGEVKGWIADGLNLGLVTGGLLPDGRRLVVVDLDTGSALPSELSEIRTVTALTGGGGRHLYFAVTADVEIGCPKLADRIDVRGVGGQVVFPGSIHPRTKKFYEFASGLGLGEVEIADLPKSLVEKLHKQQRPTPAPVTSEISNRLSPYLRAVLQAKCEILAPTLEGNRNSTLNWTAFHISQYAKGENLSEQVNEQLKDRIGMAARESGLPDHEIEATMRSGWNAGAEKPIAKKPVFTGWRDQNKVFNPETWSRRDQRWYFSHPKDEQDALRMYALSEKGFVTENVWTRETGKSPERLRKARSKLAKKKEMEKLSGHRLPKVDENGNRIPGKCSKWRIPCLQAVKVGRLWVWGRIKKVAKAAMRFGDYVIPPLGQSSVKRRRHEEKERQKKLLLVLLSDLGTRCVDAFFIMRSKESMKRSISNRVGWTPHRVGVLLKEFEREGFLTQFSGRWDSEAFSYLFFPDGNADKFWQGLRRVQVGTVVHEESELRIPMPLMKPISPWSEAIEECASKQFRDELYWRSLAF